jgi:hypothetical protein
LGSTVVRNLGDRVAFVQHAIENVGASTVNKVDLFHLREDAANPVA